jgi:hypothetical protein
MATTETLECGCCGPAFMCYAPCGVTCVPCAAFVFQTSGDQADESSNCVDLGPHLNVGVQYAGRPYRLAELGANCDGIDPGDPHGVITWHWAGKVDANGRISIDTDAPWIFTPEGSTRYCSPYPYRGYLRLQVGCPNPDYPDDEWSGVFSDDCTDGACG